LIVDLRATACPTNALPAAYRLPLIVKPPTPIKKLRGDFEAICRPEHDNVDPSRRDDMRVAFLSTPTRYGVHSIVIDDPQAATQAGVGIGDPLAKAKKAYPTLRCTEEQDGGEYSPDPAKCTGKLADGRFIWFGNDPIRMIALSPTPMT